MEGKRRGREVKTKSDREGEYDQGTLYECIEISQRTP
jgi:hypothetical protein